MAREAIVFRSGMIGKRAGIIYHHSIGSELTPFAAKHSGPKLMIYHNITPAHFFEPYDPEYARILKKVGRISNYYPMFFIFQPGIQSIIQMN